MLQLLTKLRDLIAQVATMPAGMQVACSIAAMLALGVLLVLTLRAFGNASALTRGFRKASKDASAARSGLAVVDRQKALGYLLLAGVVIVLIAFAAFVYQSWVGPAPVEPFRGR